MLKSNQGFPKMIASLQESIHSHIFILTDDRQGIMKHTFSDVKCVTNYDKKNARDERIPDSSLISKRF